MWLVEIKVKKLLVVTQLRGDEEGTCVLFCGHWECGKNWIPPSAWEDCLAIS